MPRSIRFEHYLRTLPLEERRRIEKAEADYLDSTQARNAALERNFADSMVGVQAGSAGHRDGAKFAFEQMEISEPYRQGNSL